MPYGGKGSIAGRMIGQGRSTRLGLTGKAVDSTNFPGRFNYNFGKESPFQLGIGLQEPIPVLRGYFPEGLLVVVMDLLWIGSMVRP